MEKVEITDKTLQGAIEKGLQTLGIKRDNANIEVITEPSGGILGLLGNKDAKVMVSPLRPPEKYLEHLLREIIKGIDEGGKIEIQQNEDDFYVSINGEDMGVLIGKRGQSLESLQYLINVIMHRQFSDFNGRVIIDIEGYRQRREKYITQMAVQTARKAVKMKKEITLEPMTSHDRRVVHLALRDDPYVETSSRGEEPYRKVVITPLKTT